MECKTHTAKLKQIGKGAFSTVYKHSKTKVLIKSRDNVKECMSLGQFPNSNLFPKLTQVGTSNCGKFKFYLEKYYPKIQPFKRNLTSFDYEFYRCLRDLPIYLTFGSHNSMEHWLHCFTELPKKFSARKTALISAVNALSNYGANINFEISPRNVAVHNKKLVLLDCFFFGHCLPNRNYL